MARALPECPALRVCYGPPAVAPLSFRLSLLSLAGSLLLACGGPHYRNGEYRDDETHFHVEAPASWEPLRVGSGVRGDLVWVEPHTDAIIQVHATCDPNLDIPLAALRNQLLIGFTARDYRDEETVPYAGREALRTHVVASLDGLPREMLLLILKKDGCVYDFGLVAAPGPSFESGRAPYERVLASFSTEPRP